MRAFGIVCAVLLHASILLFGRGLFPGAASLTPAVQTVELLADDKPAEEKKQDEPPPDQQKVEQETPPDAADVLKSLEVPQPADAPALDAASLGAIEQALAGGGGGGFGDALSFASGGRIGGLGKAGAGDEQLDAAFSLAEIDQRPRPVFQAQPLYPAQMRGRKVEGTVAVIFVVDATGKVVDPRIEKSSHPAFEKPALDAVRQWKFEPAIKGGQRVSCRMRAPLRFQPS